MKTPAIYPGTFDPITLGHLDILRRGVDVFGEVVLAVSDVSTGKQAEFSLDERLALARAATADMPGVSVEPFEGLLVEYARRRDARVVIRGLRAFSDFEHEFKMVLTNHQLAPSVDTVFFMPRLELSYISSQLVREIARLGGPVKDFVPPVVEAKLRERYGRDA